MDNRDTHVRAKATIENRDRIRITLRIKDDFVDGTSFEKAILLDQVLCSDRSGRLIFCSSREKIEFKKILESGTKEVELKKGAKIKLTTDSAMASKCSADVLYVDYQNMPKVLKPGSHVFIDDGLISLTVDSI
ncbi:unnamed protein product, partial [Onchocerca ochengi]|uniref:PK domain-containing protein n=1 Tax=Onchocerca ochengi TaxID=42157 RepID=A0A182EKN7_ONCOC